jgi:hypothetical protein
MSAPYWIVMPFLNNWAQTEQAIRDCLAQTDLPSPPQVLAVDNGAPNTLREAIDRWATKEPRLHVWHHRPSLPSLSATWNAALTFVWGQGGDVALVVNNDVRLHPQTYALLREVLDPSVDPEALFISAVGRRENDVLWADYFASRLRLDTSTLGGPDFSCFLITASGHWQYPFDEGFSPAYCEDCDSHRRYMLGGDGERIYSINLPYLHYASGTINAEPEKVLQWSARIAQSRAHYVRKWGGDVNQERFTIPFDADTAQDGVTNPELQRRCLGDSHAPAPDDASDGQLDGLH